VIELTERIIITSALPYINGVKHLGNLIGSLLPADVYARYLKLQGNEVIYICGTDDHGTPAELSAREAGKPVEEYCNEMYEIQKDIYERFGLNFDYFGRTHDQENHEITQELFLGLKENGYIKEDTSIQLYSVEDERFLPDRYVIGTCPHCDYERARGDQCENCTTLLDPVELINPKSVISGSDKIEQKEVTHFYIDLPKLDPLIREWIDTQEGWPQTSISIAKKWLDEGLKSRSITRNLDWGINIPLKGHEDKVFYVWFDAPIGYISMTKHWADQIKGKPELFDAFWHDPETRYLQFLGIDNVPFHAISFPGTLLGYNQNRENPYNLTNFIKGFQWLTYEGGKFSTSQNRGIFTDEALDLYPADYWRYYLLLIAPERQNTDFQWEGFQNAVNNDLNNLLGNLVNRLTTFTSRHFDDKLPKAEPSSREEELYARVTELIAEYKTEFDVVEFQKPLKALRTIWQELNRYFQEKAPWKTVKSEETFAEAATTISTVAHGLRISAILLAPFAPFSAEKVFAAIGLDKDKVHQIVWNDVVNWSILEDTTVPELKENLFTKITDDEIEELKQRYGSTDDPAPAESEEEPEQTEEKELIEFDDFSKVQMIAAKIVKAEEHPDADKLLVLTVDDGTRDDRTIVAGIKGYYELDELEGQTVIIVDNLKPATLRGIKSEGMLLAAEDDDTVAFLQPVKNVEPGSKIR